jgi:hypothetical protein
MDKGRKKTEIQKRQGKKSCRWSQWTASKPNCDMGTRLPRSTKNKKNPAYLSLTRHGERERERERKNLIQLVDGGEGGGGVHRLGLAEHPLQHDADAAAATNYSSKEKG